MLIVEHPGYLAEVRLAADRLGLRAELEQKLAYLDHYGGKPTEIRCRLWKDLAPLSFYFRIEKLNGQDWIGWFEGGLLFHGSHDGYGSGAGPTYAVSCSPETGWQVHT